MQIPPENLSLIVQYAIQDGSSNGRGNHGANLSLVSGFSLACQQFRQIALREIFRTYHVTAPSHLHGLQEFPDLYKWIRVLHCPISIAMHVTEQQYARFTYLRCVILSGAGSFGLSSVLQRLPTSIQELTLPFDHTNDHTQVLASTLRFQNLTRVRVAASWFEVPPAADVPCGDIPPHHYTYSRIAAEVLKPLSQLRIIEIDHYLTDTDVFDFHASQCPWSSASSAFCPTCWDRFGQQTINAEVTCTMIMAQGMRRLELVTWKSWFTANAEGHSRLFITRQQSPEGREEIIIRRERDRIEADWKKHMAGLSKKCDKMRP